MVGLGIQVTEPCHSYTNYKSVDLPVLDQDGGILEFMALSVSTKLIIMGD
jgi:hypothetical protein